MQEKMLRGDRGVVREAKGSGGERKGKKHKKRRMGKGIGRTGEGKGEKNEQWWGEDSEEVPRSGEGKAGGGRRRREIIMMSVVVGEGEFMQWKMRQ